jgi:hypothetical protein
MGSNAELLGYDSISSCANALFAEMVSDHPVLSILGGIGAGVGGGKSIPIGGKLGVPVTVVAGAAGGILALNAFGSFCAQQTCIYP